MPLVLHLRDVVETYRIGEEADAPSFRYVRLRAGHADDAQTDATDAKGKFQRKRFVEAWWGRVILGWTGLVDIEGRTVPVETPKQVRDDVRAELSAAGESDADEVDRWAGYRWRYSVVRALPRAVKDELERRIGADEAPAKAALGNSEPSSVNG